MNDKVTLMLLLAADDKMSPALVLAARHLANFKKEASRIGDNVSSGMATATTAVDGFASKMAGLGVGLAVAGTAALAAGFWKLNDAMSQAGAFQTRSLMTSSDIAYQLGVSFDVAGNQVEKMQMKLSKAAANLPGVTQDYVDLFNILGGTTASVFKGNTEGWATNTEDMVKRLGVLAAGSGIAGSQAGGVISRAIAGSAGFGELAQNDIIQKNSLFRQAILDGIKRLGVEQDKWKELTSDQRFKIINDALKVATPDSLIEKFNGTYESVTQGFLTYWFDPLSGVFGVLKKVNTDGGGIKSALQSWTETLQAIGTLAGAIGGAIGFDQDGAMLTLINFLDGTSSFIRNLAAYIKLAPLGNENNLGEMVAIVGNFFNGIIDNFANAVATFDPATASSFVSKMFETIADVLGSIDWGEVGLAIGSGIAKLMVTLVRSIFSGGFAKFQNEVTKDLLQIVWSVLSGFVGGLVWELGVLLKDTALGYFKLVLGNWKFLYDGLISLFGFIGSAISRISGAVSGVANFVANPVQGITNAISSNGVAGVASTAANVAGALANPVGAVMGAIGNVVKPITQPQTNQTSNKTATNIFAPNISATTNNQAMANDILNLVGAAYQSYREGMA